MQIKLDRKFMARVNARFSKYDIQVGILTNAPHKDAKTGKDNKAVYAGGPVRKKGRAGGFSLYDISAANRARMDKNYLTDPFKQPSEIMKFAALFFKMASGGPRSTSMMKRLANLTQAIVRNPILRGDYGSNSRSTQKIKGFDRKMIDTAQLFRAIKGAVKLVGRRV